MRAERRARARELLAKITPGPWHVSETSKGDAAVYIDEPSVPDAANVLFEADWGTMADAALIAAAPELLAEALDAIDRALGVCTGEQHKAEGPGQQRCTACAMRKELEQ
jgi:hypothetical protein